MRNVTLILALGVGGLFLAACGDDSDSQLNVELREYEFYVEDIGVAGNLFVGGDVPNELALVNTGSERHTFTVDGEGIDEVLEPGESNDVKVPRGDLIAFYCRLHEDQRMAGTISFAR